VSDGLFEDFPDAGVGIAATADRFDDYHVVSVGWEMMGFFDNRFGFRRVIFGTTERNRHYQYYGRYLDRPRSQSQQLSSAQHDDVLSYLGSRSCWLIASMEAKLQPI
jgi:hypothetical protein